MSTNERAAKRPRGDAEPEPEIIRSPNYWFDDGSIVLQAESTQFRLPKSLLAKHSVVFRDMLSLPPPPQDEPLIEGCPVVFLPGDKADDWNHLLAVFYPEDCFSDESCPTLASLAAVLRLSKKYDIAAFRSTCLECLKAEFPSALQGYELVRSKWINIHVPNDSASSTLDAVVCAVLLAQEIGIYSILPILFYTIASVWDQEACGFHNELFSRLDPLDQVKCLKGYTKLGRSLPETPMKWLEETCIATSSSCHSPTNCESSRIALLKDIALGRHGYQLAHVFAEWDTDWEEFLCRSCISKAKAVYKTSQTECWEKLPSYFGLPDWEELLKMDFE
ncbi:BTB domain-containing protein [Mycena kentingensis (nom. inval.)]|nr:BTB domain-containing protein [Mycena kentingensis (nom. inval.)]